MTNFDEITKTKTELDPNSILKGGYGLIAQEVTRNKNISSQARFIYSYLCSMAGNDGIAYPTQSLMMDELGMNKSTFHKYLKEILATGYIKVTQTRKNGKAYKNVYTITMDKRDIEPNRKAYVEIAIKNKAKRPSTQVNNLPSQCLKICDTDEQCHKKQESEIYDSKSNSSKSNIVVVDDANAQSENKVIDLYKSFKLEKRVTPHMTKLLKQYATKLDLEIFEDIFVNTLEKKPDSNYKYIKAILESLDAKSINSFDDYKLDMDNYKKSKKKINKPNISNGGNKGNKKVVAQTCTTKPKTKFHNLKSESFRNFTEDALEKHLFEMQQLKNM